jgi:NAD(P)H-dependent flavin oxidoreductase YrpB (nitropropane dioxygenase family)
MAKSYMLMAGRMLASGNEKRSWKSTRVVKLLGIEYPIIQAPFGGFPSQQLTAAVSNLGGLGSLGAVTLGTSAITEVIEEIRSLTTKPSRSIYGSPLPIARLRGLNRILSRVKFVVLRDIMPS